MTINLNGELYDFICIHGEKRNDVYIIEYVSGDTFVARPKDKKTFLTIKQSRSDTLKPYIVDDELYSYITQHYTYFEYGIWDLYLNAYYKGEQVLLSACDGLVFISSF